MTGCGTNDLTPAGGQIARREAIEVEILAQVGERLVRLAVPGVARPGEGAHIRRPESSLRPSARRRDFPAVHELGQRVAVDVECVCRLPERQRLGLIGDRRTRMIRHRDVRRVCRQLYRMILSRHTRLLTLPIVYTDRQPEGSGAGETYPFSSRQFVRERRFAPLDVRVDE